MQHAYNELYLGKARTSMAVMLDFAVHNLHQNADEFFGLFTASGLADLFGSGDVRIIAGMSGVELAYKVLSDSGIPAEHVSYRYTSGRSREFWAGWAVAQYQWETSRSFADIVRTVSMSSIISVCSEYRDTEIRDITASLSWMDTLRIPDHMNGDNYTNFRSRMDEAAVRSSESQAAGLKRIRMMSGLSQSQLATASGIPVRTIQQYEQRQKDISRAGYESIIKLAAALGCEPSSLI